MLICRDPHFARDDIAELATLAAGDGETCHRIFEDLKDSNPPLGTWGFKSPAAGLVEVIIAVPKLGSFLDASQGSLP